MRLTRSEGQVHVPDGAGSPRSGLYGSYSDEQMRRVRRIEQKKAAYVGEYSAVIFLNHASSEVQDPSFEPPRADIAEFFRACRPHIAFTHNPADKHDTHAAVVLRTVAALRQMPRDVRPSRLVGCEVWRDLDWLADADKIPLLLDGHENLETALLGVFDSQIAGGKRYHLAVMGRRRANATFLESHNVEAASALTFGIDLTPLLSNDQIDVISFIQEHIHRSAADFAARLARLG